MIDCPTFTAEGPVSVSDALRSVDCQSGQAVEIAFSRLFGADGALGQALTLFLTIYVALFAIGLLTGRASLRLNMLTPKMLQLGLVLTFATSWVAYQNVGWNLLVEAPDQVASVLLGTKGSATQLFALRLDTLFDVIANTAHLAQGANAQAPTGPVLTVANASPKPADLLWAASLLLLLGTVGVLIVARIALAAIMALGPVFIVLALFRGTRGLFEGWLRAAVMLALTPMLAVLLGGGTLVLIAPMIAALARAGGKVTLELATSIFLASFVYAALMVLALRAAAMITGGWRLGRAEGTANAGTELDQLPVSTLSGGVLPIPMAGRAALSGTANGGDRVRVMIDGISDITTEAARAHDGVTAALKDRRSSLTVSGTAALPDAPPRDPRIRPLGQGFRAPARVPA
jgi:type IV secretion system protein VirB6